MDVGPLWNFADPAASEAAFRAALARGPALDDALTLETQVARSLGLRSLFAEGHAVLDAVDARLGAAGAEPRVRSLLERGRLHRSAKAPAPARPLFEEAATRAEAAGLGALHVDALHMLALVAPDPSEELRANERALAVALASSEPAVQRWEAPLAHNIGMALHGLGRHDDALAAFRRALAARQSAGRPAETRVARWMVAWLKSGAYQPIRGWDASSAGSIGSTASTRT